MRVKLTKYWESNWLNIESQIVNLTLNIDSIWLKYSLITRNIGGSNFSYASDSIIQVKMTPFFPSVFLFASYFFPSPPPPTGPMSVTAPANISASLPVFWAFFVRISAKWNFCPHFLGVMLLNLRLAQKWGERRQPHKRNETCE